MKGSVAFACVWLASTGLSIPLGAGGTSQTPVTSDEQSGLNLLTGNTRVEFGRLLGTEKVRGKDDPSLPPAAGSSAKLPWYPPTNDHPGCYGGSSATKTIEQCLGTERYCQEELWGGYDNQQYGNSQECLAAREPRPQTAKPAASSNPTSMAAPAAIDSPVKTIEDTEREAPQYLIKQARRFDEEVKKNAEKLPSRLQQKYLNRFVTVLVRDNEGRFRIVFKDNATGEPLSGTNLKNWPQWTRDQITGDSTGNAPKSD